MRFKRINVNLILSATLLAAVAAYAVVDSYQVNNGASTTITEYTISKDVTNNHASGKAIFIPTKTAAEWASFYNNPPTGVTASDNGGPGCRTIPDEPTCNGNASCYWDATNCVCNRNCNINLDQASCESDTECIWDGANCFISMPPNNC